MQHRIANTLYVGRLGHVYTQGLVAAATGHTTYVGVIAAGQQTVGLADWDGEAVWRPTGASSCLEGHEAASYTAALRFGASRNQDRMVPEGHTDWQCHPRARV